MVFNVRKIFAYAVIFALVAISSHQALAQSVGGDTQQITDPGAATDSLGLPSATGGATDTTIPPEMNPYASAVTDGDVDVTTVPENPGAFQPVGISLDSNLIDLRRYPMTWAVNGTVVQAGIGKQTLLTSTKGYGQTVTISVLIELPSGNVTKKITLMPQDVSMMWEAVDSYVPPFYEGKKLPSREGVVKIVAIPNFLSNSQSIDPASMVYTWKRNGNVIPGASAYGNQAITIKNNKLRLNEAIDVTASTIDGADQASGSTSLSFYSPKIIFYEKNPSTNLVSSTAATHISLSGRSTSVTAEPFFFSTASGNPNSLSFSWTLNNQGIALGDANSQQTLTLQNPGGSGSANLALSISNPNSVFQAASNALSIGFSSK